MYANIFRDDKFTSGKKRKKVKQKSEKKISADSKHQP